MRACLVLSLLICALPAMAAPATKTILLLGDSLSASHNIPLEAGWPTLLQARLSQMRPEYRLVNASISGETTSAGLSRLPALLKQYHPAVVMLELGANDGLRGLPLSEIRQNLAAMVDLCDESGAKMLLLGIELPVNYGSRYRDGLRGIYAELAGRNHAALVPFLLQGIALDPSLMQDDGLHPTAAAQPRVLANVWPALAPLLDGDKAADTRQGRREGQGKVRAGR